MNTKIINLQDILETKAKEKSDIEYLNIMLNEVSAEFERYKHLPEVSTFLKQVDTCSNFFDERVNPQEKK